MINEKKIKESIAEMIESFRISFNESGFFNQSFIPSSNTQISDNINYNDIKYISYENIKQSILNTPKHLPAKSKEKSIKNITNEITCHVYPDAKYQTIEHGEILNHAGVHLFLTDDNGNTIDSRIIGGGYFIDFIKERIGVNPLVSGITDVGRYSMPTSAATSVIVEVPKNMESYLPEQKILNVLSKYLAAGIDAGVVYYD